MARSSYSPRLGCGVSFRVPAVSGEEDVSSILQVLAGKFPVGHPASDNLFHDCGESFRVRKVPSVVAESLFIDIAEQVERLNADVRAVRPRFRRLQKFSMVLVWTLPFTYSTAWLMMAC